VRWDPDTYREEVLDPARRAGNVPPDDLYARYGMPADVRDQKAFDEQLDAVVAYWQTLKSRRSYQRLAETLMTKHAELQRAGRLTRQGFAEIQADAHSKQVEQLSRLARDEAGRATHVGPVTVAMLRSALRGTVTEDEVRAALSKAGVRVAEQFPELPAHPHPKAADLRQSVRMIGLRLSPEAVFDHKLSGFRVLGGFRATGSERLTDEAIRGARRRVEVRPYSDPAKIPLENILAILGEAARSPGGLNALLLSEIAEGLREFIADGDFTQKTIAGEAVNLGLDEDDAGLIAAAMVAGKTVGAVRQQAEEELAEGRLRSAQHLVASLPGDDPLRQAVAARDAEVAALVRSADQELAAGRTEQAARLLHEASIKASDDPRLPSRLEALPPPPPQRAVARVDGDHVLVTWEASPALAGRVHYRVVRNEGRAPISPAEGAALVERTEQHDAADADAPPGAALFYGVFATRGGSAWSKVAATQSLIFAPEVCDVCVETGENSVALSWSVHPATDAVLAVRAEGRPPRGPDDGTAVRASLAGLTDTGLRTGAEYCYRIAASYRAPDGQRRTAAGIVVTAMPASAPEAVTQLDIRTAAHGSASLEAVWTPPPHGEVRLMLSGKPSRWPAGTQVRTEELAGLRKVPGIPRRGADGRDYLQLSLPPGRHNLIVLTVSGHTAVVGDSADVGMAEPVRDLAAFRMLDAVRLSWVWPDDATEAMVRWPDGEHRCSRRIYDDEGGVTVHVGRSETSVEVVAVYSYPGGELTAPGVPVSVPGRGVTLNYRIHRVSRTHPRQRVVEIEAEQPVTLPSLVVIRATGPYAPDDPADGEAIARIAPQSIAPGQPVRVTVELPKGRAWLACFVDPGAADRGVLLFPPAAEEMRIR
jgi:hypothetical protein